MDIPPNQILVTLRLAEQVAGGTTPKRHKVVLFDYNGMLGILCDCYERDPIPPSGACVATFVVADAVKRVVKSKRTALSELRAYLIEGGTVTDLINNPPQPGADPTPGQSINLSGLFALIPQHP
jgi:hypothetical protein